MAKKILKRIKKESIVIPDEPYELHEDTEIAALLLAVKAEAGPVKMDKKMKKVKKMTIDIPDDPELHEDTEIPAILLAGHHHHHHDVAADARKRCELYCTYCDPVCGWCDFCGRGF